MGKSKQGGGYGCTPITATIKKSTKGGMKVEQPLLNMGAPVSMMNMPGSQASPEKVGGLVKYGGKLVEKGAKRYLPAVVSGGKQLVKQAKNKLSGFVGKKGPLQGPPIVDFTPKRTFLQKAGKFIKTAGKFGAGYLGYSAIDNFIDSFTGGGDGAVGTTAPSTPKPKKKKPYVKPGGKATGSMKDYKIGSKERYDEYNARGWAHDDTTKGYKPKKKEAKVSTIKPKGVETSAKQPKVSIETKSPSIPETSKPSKKDLYTAKKKGKAGARKTAKASDKEAQAKKALAEGNTRKAARKQRSADRKKAKAKKKFSQAAQAIEVKSPAMKKGSKKY
jgi:hypothetical protein